MNASERILKERSLVLYEREVIALEKQAAALEMIAQKLCVSAIEEAPPAENPLEAHVKIGRKVAELRINPEGAKGIAWWRIREQLGLTRDEFHEGIRPEDHFKESVVERIESFEDGWECKVNLERLLGFEPTGEWLERIEACKPKASLQGRVVK